MTRETLRAPITATDRVSDVLARGDAAAAVLATRSPQFEKFRTPALGRVMARLMTVAQAARIAGVPPDALVRDLNAALGIAAPVPSAEATAPPAESNPAPPAERMAAERMAGAHVVELDVRADLRHGREPFARIMAAVGALREGAVLHLRAPFEPVPLFAVLQARGFAHHAERQADDDWHVWFYRPERAPTIESSSSATMSRDADARMVDEVPNQPHEVRLDVRGLEPPEPMTRTLEALERLPDGTTLVQVNARVPQFLLPILDERGFEFAVDTTDPDAIEVRIHRARDPDPPR